MNCRDIITTNNNMAYLDVLLEPHFYRVGEVGHINIRDLCGEDDAVRLAPVDDVIVVVIIIILIILGPGSYGLE